jgi:hypothetical protein
VSAWNEQFLINLIHSFCFLTKTKISLSVNTKSIIKNLVAIASPKKSGQEYAAKCLNLKKFGRFGEQYFK